MRIKQKKELAKVLYINEGLAQKDIAARVDVTPKTMSKWCADWKELKQAKITSVSETIARIERQMANFMKKFDGEDSDLMTAADADILIKLSKTRDSLMSQIGLDTFIDVFKQYNIWLLTKDPELCRTNNAMQDLFITTKAGER